MALDSFIEKNGNVRLCLRYAGVGSDAGALGPYGRRALCFLRRGGAALHRRMREGMSLSKCARERVVAWPAKLGQVGLVRVPVR